MIRKNIFRRANQFGVCGMFIGGLWLLLSLLPLRGSTLGEIARWINGPVYQITDKIFNYIVRQNLANKHDGILYFIIAFFIYSIIGFLLGFIGKLIHITLWYSRRG